jgi:hypothetical protein
VRGVLSPFPRRGKADGHVARAMASVRALAASDVRKRLSQIIPIGERYLRQMIEVYAEHDHLERNHQGLGNRLIDGEPSTEPVRRVECHERIGGLLRFYRAAS